MDVPEIRVSAVNEGPVREDRDHVVYWMIAQRRVGRNFGLQHAVQRARDLGKRLVVLEALRCGARWSSARTHRFVLDGMAVNAAAFRDKDIAYLPYVERSDGDGKGLLAALAKDAALVVTDEYPCFFLPRMVAAAGEKLDVLLEQVDGNGILPLRATDRHYTTAHSFRRGLQKMVASHLSHFPLVNSTSRADDVAGAKIPSTVSKRWSPVPEAVLDGSDDEWLKDLPVDQDVVPVALTGGSDAADDVIARFLEERLGRYGEDRNHPDDDAASGLSPYLHFGHASSHDVVHRIFEREDWSPDSLPPKATGKREGWWGLSAPAEAFLDELITWRELGFVFNHHRSDYDRFSSLPDWAKETLSEHEDDERENVYTLKQFERAETHDDLWNAAQRQLVREGRIHNYLRMLWGKKILHWSKSPKKALDILVELNNKYALDGRDPNSYSGIFWTLGRFDRAWGPEREIFGKVRYMTSGNTRKKVRLKGYLERFAEKEADD